MVTATSLGLSNDLHTTSFFAEGSLIKSLLDEKKFSEALGLADRIADAGQRGEAFREIFDAAIKDPALGSVADARCAAVQLPGMKAKGVAFQKVIDRYLRESNHIEAQETFKMMRRYSSGVNIDALLKENKIGASLSACSEVPSGVTALKIAGKIIDLNVDLKEFQEIQEMASSELGNFPGLQLIILRSLLILCEKLNFDSFHREALNKQIEELSKKPDPSLYFTFDEAPPTNMSEGDMVFEAVSTKLEIQRQIRQAEIRALVECIACAAMAAAAFVGLRAALKFALQQGKFTPFSGVLSGIGVCSMVSSVAHLSLPQPIPSQLFDLCMLIVPFSMNLSK